MKRIKVRKFGVHDELLFSASVAISEHWHHKFDFPLRESSEKYLAEVGEAGSQIVKGIMSLPGIVSVTIQPYQIIVRKGEAFDWTWNGVDIKAKVIEMLIAEMGEGVEITDDTTPPPTGGKQ